MPEKTLLEVIEVKPLANFQLFVKFNDGTERQLDFSSFVSQPPEVFIPIQDPSEFQTVKINPVGGVCWSCGADLSAEYLKSF